MNNGAKYIILVVGLIIAKECMEHSYKMKKSMIRSVFQFAVCLPAIIANTCLSYERAPYCFLPILTYDSVFHCDS
ncbi:hypothetical protein LQZ18_18550 [Lachnospiraceae bacterium ZAX-1]